MNVLVLGSGGREHAIAWSIKQSKECGELYVMPGNPGCAQIATCLNGAANDFEAVKEAVLAHNINLVVVGPEEPLVLGLADKFKADSQLKNILFVGPGAAGARLEGSKEFAKEFMNRHNIPTAKFKSFTKSTLEEGKQFLGSMQPPYVLKADGLAAGKGVLILNSLEEACAELESMVGGKFGSASSTVVIEQFLSGIEVSVFILTDGEGYLILPQAKDYKRIGEGDKGLNTGGMGAVSPVPFADELFMQKVEQRIIKPTIEGLKKDGIPYNGFIFLGLICCAGEPYVIEYNVRMGDPETQAVMTRIKSDMLLHLVACAKGELSGQKIEISKEAALAVIAVSEGYPQNYAKGFEIEGNELLSNNTFSGAVKLFHSGTAQKEGRIVTSGGRVLSVVANSVEGEGDLAAKLQECRQKAYSQIDKVSYRGKTYRRDIGEDILKMLESGR